MSFFSRSEKRILRRKIAKPCCNMAAAYAVACFGKYFDDRGVVLQTENEGVAAFAQKALPPLRCAEHCAEQGAPDRPGI